MQSAWAGPEWHVGIQPALAADFPDEARLSFDGSLDADLLFGRDRSGTVGYGPALELGTWAFSEVRLLPMARVVVPVGEIDVGCSIGPRLRVTDGFGTGVAGRLFIGYRAYNYGGTYGTGFGLFAGAEDAEPRAATAWTIGLHLDAMWAALPVIALASWVRGAPDD